MRSIGPEPTLRVVAALIEDAAGRIFLSRRLPGSHLAGHWEFPGGKVEPGEDDRSALARELREELAIEPRGLAPFMCVRHHYPERRVELAVYRVAGFSGTPHGVEGQQLGWFSLAETDRLELPPADRPLLAALRGPAHYLVTGPFTDRASFLHRLDRALAAGVGIVQLRAPGLDAPELHELAVAAAACCRRARVPLVVNAAPGAFAGVDLAGYHLNRQRLMALGQRPWRDGPLLGASCHNATELDRAEALGLDYALLSPVAPTASHPGRAPLGWARFAALLESRTIPVYALGGVGPGDLASARWHGAVGIAGISGYWSD